MGNSWLGRAVVSVWFLLYLSYFSKKKNSTMFLFLWKIGLILKKILKKSRIIIKIKEVENRGKPVVLVYIYFLLIFWYSILIIFQKCSTGVWSLSLGLSLLMTSLFKLGLDSRVMILGLMTRKAQRSHECSPCFIILFMFLIFFSWVYV